MNKTIKYKIVLGASVCANKNKFISHLIFFIFCFRIILFVEGHIYLIKSIKGLHVKQNHSDHSEVDPRLFFFLHV